MITTTDIQELIQELIHEAYSDRDSTKLRYAATIIAEQDEEEAERHLKVARKWDDADWDYDNYRDNQ